MQGSAIGIDTAFALIMPQLKMNATTNYIIN